MATSPRQYNPKNDQEHINRLLCEAQEITNLSDWESEFIENLLSQKHSDIIWNLTGTQYKKLVEISDKKDEFQVW